MKTKTIIPRELANLDVAEAVAYHLGEQAVAAAMGLVDAVEQAYAHIGRHPATGSPRYGHDLHLPGLRAWPLKRYPYTVFYLEYPDCIDVWRVLHSQRDIPAWLQKTDGM